MARAGTDFPSPAMMASSGLCIGCGTCASLQEDAGIAWDQDGHLKPASPEPWLQGRSAALATICPFSSTAMNEDQIAAELYPDAPCWDASVGGFLGAYVGHATQGDFRARGSSGGLVSWLAAELLRRGLIDGVAHVVPRSRDDDDGRLFAYAISRSEAELQAGAKSRYYPVELSQVLREMRKVPGRYAVIGIPCFIKAVQLVRREDTVLRERIAFTLGLFCGHMKSARMVDSFAWQMGAAPADVAAIDYRLKDERRPANWYTAQLTLRDGSTCRKDWWHLADGDWGAGFFMNPACNYCDDVTAETADIAMGDAWLEPYSSDGRGTNVVVVRSPALQEIVAEARAERRLSLDPVDADFIARTQAAGLRQRREGLSYRLARSKLAIRSKKRVAPSRRLPRRRKLIYRMRMAISRWSHRLFRLAHLLRWPALYTQGARVALSTYHGLAYSRGSLGNLVDRWLDPARRDGD
jgi:coenzyme F420-reducing hydrogenase beta subunit